MIKLINGASARCAGATAIIAIALFALPSALQAADNDLENCAALSQQLGAEYVVSSAEGATAPLFFWRSGNSVLYRYPNRQVAEKWTLTGNGYLKPVRFFLEDKRAIEYDAFDINRGKGTKNWEMRSQWFSQERIDAMQLRARSGEGCLRVETYEYSEVGKGTNMTFSSATLVWLPELRLVQSYTVTTADAKGQRSVSQWQLQHLETDASLVASSLHAFDDFAATDYADIGDNESDPFLMKMIKLGFVGHGASGFYNSDGSPLAGGHAH